MSLGDLCALLVKVDESNCYCMDTIHLVQDISNSAVKKWLRNAPTAAVRLKICVKHS